ncbi:hypothetical protein BSK66_31650 [Paenibacillus odorifer]|uniref:hypothetical protein n=1 Tax=Paenibacillus TaxID=44249 RepID=UPI0003E24E93|nr:MULTISPECIES: hypothetical protein [Paenibacillus]ETT46226.1 hypothetical protein C171_28262 [Paenibacillus sp. FSL H8-237]OME46648.1 hypothetical protein BSK66_31650 [Paenibacillus odorifer]
MGFFDGDFYREPSEFEEQIDQLKESLMNAVKDEHKVEIEWLRKENAELQEVKQNLETIKRDYNQKVVELDMQKRNLKNEVRRERLQELMGDFNAELFNPSRDRKSGPKCDKCNDKRRIPFLSPSGKEMEEDCACKNNIIFFKPTTNICSSFAIRNGEFIAWYKSYSIDRADGMELDSLGVSGVAKFIWSGESFENITEQYYNVFFKTIEDCQSYCDWLTEKEANKLKER